MNFRTTLILLVLLAGALVFVIVSNKSGEPPKPGEGPGESAKVDDQTKGKPVLPDLKAADVERVLIRPGEGSAAGGPTVELVRDGPMKWRLVQPVAWPAVATGVDDLMSAIVESRSTQSVELTPANAASVGLEKPRYRIELTDTQKRTHKLAVGDLQMGRLFVAAGDAPKVASAVTAGPLADRLAKGGGAIASDLRDPRLATIESLQVKQVQIDRGGGRRVVLHKVGGDWKVVWPQATAAEAGEVAGVNSTLANLQAAEFAPPGAQASRAAGFDRPRATVTLSTTPPPAGPSTAPTPADGPTVSDGVTFVIGNPADLAGKRTWVKVSNPAVVARVEVPTADLDRILNASALSFRDRKVMDLDPAQATGISIAVSKPGEEAKVTRLVRTVEELEKLGPQFTPPTSGPATAPAAAAPPTTTPSTGPATRPSARASTLSPTVALFGLLQATTTPAEPQPTTVPAAPTTVPVTPTTAPSSQPATQPAAATQSTTRPASSPATPPRTKGPPRWVIASAADRDADQAAVQQLLDAMHPLKATGYVEPKPATAPATTPATTPTTGPATAPTTGPATVPATQPVPTTYVLTITTRSAAGAVTTHELRFTDPGGTAKLIGTRDGLTFELDRELLTKLNRDFVPPPPGMRPPEPEPEGMRAPSFDRGMPPGR